MVRSIAFGHARGGWYATQLNDAATPAQEANAARRAARGSKQSRVSVRKKAARKK